MGRHPLMTDSAAPNFDSAIRSAITNQGQTLFELSQQAPVLVVFLRHLGCTFCREAVADIAKKRQQIEADGTRICFVYMPERDKAGNEKPEVAERFFTKYGASDLPRIADPEQQLYKAFELRRGSIWELFGLKVWWRGFLATVFGLHMVGKLVGDGFQMPGVFLLKDGTIKRAFRHKTAADRPDYCELASA